jgi:hypothetical protein
MCEHKVRVGSLTSNVWECYHCHKQVRIDMFGKIMEVL